MIGASASSLQARSEFQFNFNYNYLLWGFFFLAIQRNLVLHTFTENQVTPAV